MIHQRYILQALLAGFLFALASCTEVRSEQEISAYAEKYGLLGYYDEHHFDNTILRSVYDPNKDTLLLLLTGKEAQEAYLLSKASTSIDALFDETGALRALQESDETLLMALRTSLSQEVQTLPSLGAVNLQTTSQSRSAPDCMAETNFIKRLLCFFSQTLKGSTSDSSDSSSEEGTTADSEGTSSSTEEGTSPGPSSPSPTSDDTEAETAPSQDTSGGTGTGEAGSGSSGEGTSGGQTSRPLLANLSGTVWYDKDNNEQRDANEPPLEGVVVFLDTNGNSVYDSDEPSEITSASGTFVFSGLQTGQSYRVMEKLDLGWHNTVAAVGSGQTAFDLKIINGEDTTIETYPYMLSLQGEVNDSDPRHMCGATLISPKYALTAFHCVEVSGTFFQPASKVSNYRVRASSSYHAKDGKTVAMSRFIRFPGAKIRPNPLHDIAIIELEESLYEVPRVFIPTANDKALEQEGAQPTVIGWGRINSSHKDIPDVLQELQVTLLSEREGWRRVTSGFQGLTTGALRAQGAKLLFFIPSRAGICNGDSGGPMLTSKDVGEDDARPVQIGVTSFTANVNIFNPKLSPCIGNRPSGYTRVSGYLDWIDEHVPLETSKVIDVSLSGDTEVSFGDFH